MHLLSVGAADSSTVQLNKYKQNYKMKERKEKLNAS